MFEDLLSTNKVFVGLVWTQSITRSSCDCIYGWTCKDVGICECFLKWIGLGSVVIRLFMSKYDKLIIFTPLAVFVLIS